MSRHRVENRAHLIYDYLCQHLGEGFTIDELCHAVGINDGATTRSAIRRARDLATEAGLHFPPAVPTTGFTYLVTRLPGDALDPALHMARIETGVRIRKQDGTEYMRRHLRDVPPELRPIARAFVNIERKTERALAELRREADDMIVELVALRRSDPER
jgi:hypothetical protein